MEDAEVEDEEDAAYCEEAVDGGGPVHVDGEHRGVDLEVVQELGQSKRLDKMHLIDHGLLGVLQVVDELCLLVEWAW